MAIQFGGTQTESVQVPSQSAPGIFGGLGGVLGTLAGLALAPVTAGMSTVASAATMGLGASIGGSIGSGLGGAIGSGMTETQTYDVPVAQDQQMSLGQMLTQMNLPIPPPSPTTAGIGELEMDSTFGTMPSYLEQPPLPFYG
jgi:hypothetical protein